MKRLILFFLVCFICAGLFAGGGQQGGSDSGLTTLRIWGNSREYPVAGATVTMMDWYNGTIPSRLWDKFNEEMAKLGIKLDMTLIMQDQMATAFTTLVASGQFNNYDWVSPINFTDTKARYNLVDQGLLLALDTAIDQYSDGTARNYFRTNPAGIKINKINTLADGHMYWLHQTDAFYYKDPSNIAGEPFTGCIRYDWLTQLGLKYPTTMDELFDTIKAFQDRDANGNGVRDEVAMVNISEDQFAMAFASYFGMGNSNLAYMMGDKIYSPWYSERARDYITYMQRLYNAGLLKLTTQGNELPGNIVSFYGTYFQNTWDEPMIIVPTGRPNAYYSPVVIQAFPNTQNYVIEQPGVNHYPASGMYCVPARSRNVEKVVKLIDYFHTMDYYYLGELGIEGYTYRMVNGIPERLQPNSSNVGYDQELISASLTLLSTGWQCNFPRMRKGDKIEIFQQMIDAGRAQGYSEGYTVKNEYLADFYDNRWPIVVGEGNIDGLIAFPTAAEADRQAAILPDLKTYSAELMTALIMGQKSLNDWNTYMADLRRLGLDELVTIYQGRVDRMK